MTVDDVIQAFATAGDNLPREAMQWSLDHWEEAAPRLVAELEQFPLTDDPPEDEGAVVFFALHLMAQMREARGWQGLCRLLHHAGASDAALGDALTESLCSMIIGMFDGDLPSLQAVIEDADADDYVRHAAVESLAWLVSRDRTPGFDMRAYLRHLFATMQPRHECYVWDSVTIAVAMLRYADLVPEVSAAFRDGRVDPSIMQRRDFEEALRKAQTAGNGDALFEGDHVRPLDDAIGLLSGWYCFSEEAKQQRERWQAEAAKRDERETAALASFEARAEDLLESGVLAPRHAVGRNDPCWCGSGKKYKKCHGVVA